MKRLTLLFAALISIFLMAPALAWEVSPDHIDLAARLLPGYAVLSGASSGECTALLVESPDDQLHLAFCTEDAASLTQPLPEQMFWITDAKLIPDSAMLILEDYGGTAYFVGCLPEEDGWTASVSTALPEGTELWHTGTSTALCYLEWETTVYVDGKHQHTFSATIRPKNDTWQITTTSQDDTLYLFFADGFVRSLGSMEKCIHGELLFSLDVTEVNWTLLPTTVEAAADHMNLSDWAILTEETDLCDAPGGTHLAHMNPGAHLLILAVDGDWVQVAPGGSAVSGWLAADALLIGSRQLEAEYLAPDNCPVVNRYANELDVYLYPSEDPTNPLLIHLNQTEAYPVYAMGVWSDGSWTMIYDPAIPGGVGFVHTEQINALPANGLG